MEISSNYEQQIFIRNQFSSDKVGTYYVLNPNSESIFNIFSLQTDYSETLIGSVIPLPGKTPEQIHGNLVSNGFDIGEKEKVGIRLNASEYDPNADLFNDLDEIKKIVQWWKG